MATLTLRSYTSPCNYVAASASWLWRAEPFPPAVPVTRTAIPAAVSVLITARDTGLNKTHLIMLFRPASTSGLEIWCIICSDSSLSSPLLIIPFCISYRPPFLLPTVSLFFTPPSSIRLRFFSHSEMSYIFYSSSASPFIPSFLPPVSSSFYNFTVISYPFLYVPPLSSPALPSYISSHSPLISMFWLSILHIHLRLPTSLHPNVSASKTFLFNFV